MNENPKIAVIILGYNDENNILDAINSVLGQTYQNFDLIYIDNASTDDSLKIVEENFSDITIIKNEKNLGYAGAYAKILNQIFQQDYDCAVLLNSDVIVDERWLEELANSAYADEKIAIAQPKIFLWGENKNLANTFGNEINYLGFGFCGNYKNPDSKDFDNDKEIVSASGASLLIKKDAYLKIGNLDKDFFAYLEDQDLSWRAVISGYKVVLSAKSIMWHKYTYQKNSRNHWKFFTLERNRLFFLYKNFSAKMLFLIFPIFVFMELGVLINSIPQGFFWDKIKAYAAFFKYIKSLKQKRSENEKLKKLSDKELFEKLSPTIEFQEINSPALRIANFIIKRYYLIVKRLI